MPEFEVKVLRIEVDHWRNLRGVDVTIPAEDTLVCLVGENGTGKSGLLELVSAAAHRAGLTSGIDLPRGDPFSDSHDVRVTLQVTTAPQSFGTELGEEIANAWDGRLVIESSGNGIRATDGAGSTIAGAHVAEVLRTRQTNSYLYLDADRSYPPFTFGRHQFGDALARPWDTENDRRQSAFRRTRTLYEEWIQYLVATEVQDATRLHQAHRRALDERTEPPVFVDPFGDYRSLLLRVLPHLKFSGVNQQAFDVLYDSAGQQLSFNALSGGEREIAFLVGQIDRFRLREGLLLVDEPELHLNPDLLRNWIAFLRDTMELGQVWVATHSLEAVEVAGAQTTFVLVRDGATRLVNRVERLSNLPLLETLSASVGSPAFAMASLGFVFVEGERGQDSGERERFFSLCGQPQAVRFMEGGSGDEVTRKVDVVRLLAEEAGQPIAVGGVVDRDFKTDGEVAAWDGVPAVHVLECHEIENLYLHPDALGAVLVQNGDDPTTASALVRRVSDSLAGQWILGSAIAAVWREGAREQRSWLRDKTLRRAVQIQWSAIESDPTGYVDTAEPGDSAWTDEDRELFRASLRAGIDQYATLRESDALWKMCAGKEVFHGIPALLGVTGWRTLERRIIEGWARGEAPVPEELQSLRDFVSSLSDTATAR
jgi:predicted ATPase